MPTIPLFFLSPWHKYTWANYGPLYLPSVLSFVQVQNITQTTAQITIMSPASGRWKVAWGTGSKKYEGISPWASAQANIGSAQIITGLQSNTLYYFNVFFDGIVSNPNGLPLSGAWYGDEQSFTTLPIPGVDVPPTVTGISAVPTGTTCVITWNTSTPCTGVVNWGLTNAYGSTINDTTTAPTANGGTVTLTGLVSGDTYHYQIVATSRNGGLITQSADQTFTMP